MRYVLVVLALVGGIGLVHACSQRLVELAPGSGLTEDARLAIEVRCRDHNSQASRQCRSVLKRLYLAGTLDPDTTLRDYCAEVEAAPWGGRRPPPPALCVERYGGWSEG